jgi:DNA-binding GntR family transcriptional regulator
VEGAATALSAPYLSREHLRRAREVNERMRRTLDDFDPHRFTELNLEFHAVLFEECPNPHILDLVHRGWNRMRMLRDSSFSFVPGRALESVDEHDRIVDLIEQGADPLEIELAARRHRTATLDAMLAYQASHKHPTAAAAAAR